MLFQVQMLLFVKSYEQIHRLNKMQTYLTVKQVLRILTPFFPPFKSLRLVYTPPDLTLNCTFYPQSVNKQPLFPYTVWSGLYFYWKQTGTPCWWRSWLRHYTACRKVAGSIPDGVVIFIYYGPGVDSAPNRNEYQGYFLGGKGGRCVGLTTLPPSCADCHDTWKP
jgi:hypothetical protein